jgi:hypothetical protein
VFFLRAIDLKSGDDAWGQSQGKIGHQIVLRSVLPAYNDTPLAPLPNTLTLRPLRVNSGYQFLFCNCNSIISSGLFTFLKTETCFKKINLS